MTLLARDEQSQRWLCLRLDRQSALLLSPLYRHRVELALLAKEEVEADLLDEFFQSCCYRVVAWRSFTSLLKPTQRSSDETLRENLSAVLRQSFFIQMLHYRKPLDDGDSDALHKQIGDCLPAQKRSVYFSEDDARQWSVFRHFLQLRQQGRVTEAIASNYETLLKQTLKQLFEPMFLERKRRGVKKNVSFMTRFENNAQAIHFLMGECRALRPLFAYLTHHLLDMRCLSSVYRTVSRQQSDSNVSLINELTRLQRPVLDDLEACLTLLEDLFQRPTERLSSIETLKLSSGTAFFHAVKLCCNGILQTLYSKWTRTTEISLLKGQILESLVLPLVVLMVTKRAERDLIQNHSSLQSIPVDELFYYFCTLFSLPIEDFDWKSFNIRVEEEHHCAILSICFTFEDFPALLARLWQRMTVDNAHGWLRRRENASTQRLTKRTSLFFLPTEKSLFALERTNVSLLRSDFVDASTIQELPTTFEKLLRGESMQLHFILLSPLELRENRDLLLLATIVEQNLFTTAILRERQNQFLTQRLADTLHTRSALDLRHLYADVVHCSSNFSDLTTQMARPLLLVPDCHTLSITQMNNLLRWLLQQKRRHSVEHVVLMGSFALMPCAIGQAFIDAARTLHHSLVSMPSRENARDSFERLLQKHWSFLTCRVDSHTQLERTYAFRLEAGRSMLYHVATIACLRRLIERVLRPHFKRLSLHLLYKRERNAVTADQMPRHITELTRDGNDLGFLTREINQLDATPVADASAESVFVVRRETLAVLSRVELMALFIKLRHLIVVDSQMSKSGDDALTLLLLQLFEENKNTRRRESFSSSSLCV